MKKAIFIDYSIGALDLEPVKQPRLRQGNATPDTITTRNLDDGMRYVQTIARYVDRPLKGSKPDAGSSTDILYAIDRKILSIWNQSTDSWTEYQFA
jgi:hypothetical protein